MGKKEAGDRVSCDIEIVLYGDRKPEVVTGKVFLEDAQAFERALAKHRKWRKRNRTRDYKQIFTFVNIEGAEMKLAFDAVYTFEIVHDGPKPRSEHGK